MTPHPIYSNIYWIGGSPCSGKSTVAEILADRYHLHYYNCDHAFTRHQQMSDPTVHPTLHRLGTLTSDEIWLVPIAEQVERVIAIYREEFGLILADLEALPSDRPILAEGAALMPDLVARNPGWAQRSAWVVPTPAFQQRHYSKRSWVHAVLPESSDPDQAFANWMARDITFAEYVAGTAEQCGLPVLHVDGTRTIADNAAWTATKLGLAT